MLVYKPEFEPTVCPGEEDAMPYEIFISYSRQAPGMCRDVLRILEEELGYVGTVFVDTQAIPGGSEWAAQIRSTLREVQYVLLLATSEAVDNPDFIRKEISAAREQEPRPDIIPIEFDVDAAEKLLGEGTIQHIKAGRNGDACLDPIDLERRLRLALTQRTKNRHRKDASEWVDGNLPLPSFWENLWESLLPRTGSIAIVAPAGRGKSVIAAHHLQHQLCNPRTWPVVLRPGMVGGDFGELLQSIDAKDLDDLSGQLQTLQEYDHNMVFVVDGLDQIRFDDDPEHIRTGDLLRCLSEAANLVVTCRDDVWGAAYGPQLAIDVAVVDELAEAEVSRFVPAGAGNRLLRTSLFLDLAIHRQQVWWSMPRTDIDFFRKLFHGVESDAGGLPDATGRNKRAILRNLAAHQLNELTYEVPRSAVENDLNLPPAEFRRALRSLKDDRLLVERSLTLVLGRNVEPTLRLAHDLLDCFSIADAMFSAEDRYAAARSVCNRSERECGWSVLSMLVRLAHYYSDDVLLRTVFGEFLATLDRKRFNSSYMARAWAVTYVLREQLPILLPLVLEALAGRPALSLKPDAVKQTGSRLDDDARLTPEAASSVASAFLGLEAGDQADVSRVVPLLSAGLHKWELKGRFIDALARYETDEVRRILIDFGNQMLDSHEDLPCLRYVAEGLQRFQRDRLLVSLLERIATHPEVDPITRRRAYQSLQAHDRRAVPERDDEEIVYGLALRDEKGRPSDWRVVREYALYIREQVTINRGQFGPAVCGALITSLQHDMTYVRSPAATALGCFDEPMARDALLDQLINDVLPAEIRDACLQALERQYERISDPGRRQTFRLLLLQTARIAGERPSVSLAHRLSELAMKGAKRDGWLADPGALQVVPPWQLARPVTIRTKVRDGPPIEPTFATLIRQFNDFDTGPDLEVKYRFTDIAYRTDHSLEISLAPTTWSDSNKFYTALRSGPGAASHDSAGAWIEPVPLGRTALPGIAAVHGIVLTTDDQVLLAQRNIKVGYAPLHWSASFEEQLNEHDLGADEDPFTHAAYRGFYEEFAAEIDPARISTLSALLQLDLLNLSMVMLLLPSLTAAQIEERWSNLAQDSREAKCLGWLPCGSLHYLTRRKDFYPLHVTSRMRCELLRRWIQESSREAQ
ncbi:MAG: TIR domain-containing protein [Pseudonocardiaceae bacterium]